MKYPALIIALLASMPHPVAAAEQKPLLFKPGIVDRIKLRLPYPGSNFKDNSLLLYIPFNYTAEDMSGHGNHGLAANLQYVKGGLGSNGIAGRFRKGTAVAVAANTFPSGNSPRTLSCWVMVKGHLPGGSVCTNTETTICGYGQTRWNRAFALFGDSFNEPSNSSKNGFFAWSQWGDSVGITEPAAARQHKWYMLTATYDGKTVRTYRNGKFYHARPFKLQTASCSTFIIGQRDWRRYTDGLIDEVRLYSRALSAAEVKARYDKDVATLANPGTIGK